MYRSLRYSPLLLGALLILPLLSYGDIYRWTDDSGKVHIVDDLGKVPPAYRKGAHIYEVDEDKKKTKTQRPATKKRSYAPRAPVGSKLYGDMTAKEWKRVLEKKREDIEALEGVPELKEKYIVIFERGRMLGQIYEQSEIEMYLKYKDGVVKDKAERARLKKELKELLTKARKYGVPKSARGGD